MGLFRWFKMGGKVATKVSTGEKEVKHGEWRWEIVWRCQACGNTVAEDPWRASVSTSFCEKCGTVSSFVAMKRRYRNLITLSKAGGVQDYATEYCDPVGL